MSTIPSALSIIFCNFKFKLYSKKFKSNNLSNFSNSNFAPIFLEFKKSNKNKTKTHFKTNKKYEISQSNKNKSILMLKNRGLLIILYLIIIMISKLIIINNVFLIRCWYTFANLLLS